MSTPKVITLSLALVVLLSLGLWTLKSDTKTGPLGSVSVSNEYLATSTANGTVYGAFNDSRLIKTGYGALGSLVITGADTGIMIFWDATTTDITKRESTKSTSTIHIASIPASLAAGTYTFDAEFSDGLYVEIVSGNAPTSTILYR